MKETLITQSMAGELGPLRTILHQVEKVGMEHRYAADPFVDAAGQCKSLLHGPPKHFFESLLHDTLSASPGRHAMGLNPCVGYRCTSPGMSEIRCCGDALNMMSLSLEALQTP